MVNMNFIGISWEQIAQSHNPLALHSAIRPRLLPDFQPNYIDLLQTEISRTSLDAEERQRSIELRKKMAETARRTVFVRGLGTKQQVTKKEAFGDIKMFTAANYSPSDKGFGLFSNFISVHRDTQRRRQRRSRHR